jgi:hypothetical protein
VVYFGFKENMMRGRRMTRERAEEYLKGRTFTKCKHVARALDISTHAAGRLIRALGWTVWGSKTCTNKTFVRPGYEDN